MIYRIHRLLRLKGMTSRFFFWVTVLVILTSALYVLVFIVIDKNHRINDATDKLQFELHNQHMIIENWVHDRLAEVRLFANFPVSKDRKSTRLNSSHVASSYAVLCLKQTHTRSAQPHSE